MKTPKMTLPRMARHPANRPKLRARHMSTQGRSAFPTAPQAFPPTMPPDDAMADASGAGMAAGAPGDMGQ